MTGSIGLILALLCLACVALLILERLGLPVTLRLDFKGDVKRETRFLAQYGQSICTVIAVALIYCLDPKPSRTCIAAAAAVTAASLIALIVKRSVGRVRPGREQAGAFLGPTFRHANYRESFPSSHSACAVALSGILSLAYPHASAVFWALAMTTACLRYILDAHWPSDVLAGIALGLAVSQLTWWMVS